MSEIYANCKHCGDQALELDDVKVFLVDDADATKWVYQFTCQSPRHPDQSREGEPVSRLVRNEANQKVLFLLAMKGCEVLENEPPTIQPSIIRANTTRKEIEQDLSMILNASEDAISEQITKELM
jgi:hypothetical protein